MSINIKASLMMALLSAYSITVVAQDEVSDRMASLVNQAKYQYVLDELAQLDDADKTLETAKFRALALLKLGQYSQAELSYIAIQEQDDGVDVNNNLGLIYLRQSRLSEAIRVFQRNISRFPEDPAAYRNLGDVYLMLAKLTYKRGAESAGEAGNLEARVRDIDALTKAEVTLHTAQKDIEVDEPISQAVDNELEANTPDDSQVALNIGDAVDQKTTVGANAAKPDIALDKEPEIQAFLKSWVAALSSKEMDLYLDHYVSGTNAYDAAKSRLASLSGEVNANPDEPNVSFVSETQASVVFDEWVGPRGNRSKSFKEFKLRSEPQGWKISEEKVLFSYR